MFPATFTLPSSDMKTGRMPFADAVSGLRPLVGTDVFLPNGQTLLSALAPSNPPVPLSAQSAAASAYGPSSTQSCPHLCFFTN